MKWKNMNDGQMCWYLRPTVEKILKTRPRTFQSRRFNTHHSKKKWTLFLHQDDVRRIWKDVGQTTCRVLRVLSYWHVPNFLSTYRLSGPAFQFDSTLFSLSNPKASRLPSEVYRRLRFNACYASYCFIWMKVACTTMCATITIVQFCWQYSLPLFLF